MQFGDAKFDADDFLRSDPKQEAFQSLDAADP